MGRQHTHLVQKLSPFNSRLQKTAISKYVKVPQKSPLAAIHPSVRDVKGRLQSSNTNRFLKTRSQLSTIREEPQEEDEEETYDHSFDPYRELHALERDEERGAHNQRDLNEEDLMDWDEESTLVALLQEGTPEEDEEEELAQLADKLKGPMSAQGAVMKKYLADTLVPVLTRVKEVHSVLEDKVDLAFGAGLLTFDEVCKKVEAMALRDEDDLKIAYTDAQDNMTTLLGQLQQAYSRREQLWTALQENVDTCATRANAALQALPTELEVAIAQLERKSKDLDKDGKAASKQKMLMGLLEKL